MQMIRIVEPEGTGEAVRVPRREQRRRDPDEVGEDGNGDGEHERGTVHQQHQEDPRRPAQHGMRVEIVRAPEKSDEEQFGGRVRVQRAGDQEVGDGDAVSGFLPVQGKTAERRAGDGIADVDVHDDGEDDIEGRRDALKRVSCLHRGFGMSHFGDEDEEHEVTFPIMTSVPPITTTLY